MKQEGKRAARESGFSGEQAETPAPDGGALRHKRTAERTGGVQSLRRALSILKVIAAAGDGVTLTEIARATDLASSTVHRLLTTLQQDRFIQFKSAGARWVIGVDAFTVGSAFLGVRDIARGARPLLRRLMEQSGETANLAVLSEDMAVYMEQVESLQTVRAICKPGGRVVLHSTSLGKSMLAAMRPEEVNRILNTKGMTRFTRKTIDTPAGMASHLSEVRAAGYAVDDEEYSVGLRCVAAAVLNEHGDPIGAISVSGPAIRVARERLPQIGSLVRAIASELTLELGGRAAAPARRDIWEVSTTRNDGQAAPRRAPIRISNV
ncbi:IclR family transcriptional regulator [Methylocapsa sp. S129]|uniref:IclR family transcriptional regulator n=1 Tax=Methylocapsa sp. S129 TaxID=1641869 RepID=UPI00131C0A66|nr:IclR family transcriptional regulator C-terminal domain-containing protein [Methylocapsa sp. S129]